jgi:hypothetical protein
MTRDPVMVVREYVRSSDKQLRQNAVTALAAIGSADSLALLVETALIGDDVVRGRAELELLKLQGDSAQAAYSGVLEALADPMRRQAAYRLLGKISQNCDLQFPRQRLLPRLRLVASSGPLREPGTDRSDRWRAVVPAIAGGLLGFFAWAGYLKWAFRTQNGLESVLASLALGVVIVGPLLAIVASRRAEPINLHADQHAAGLLEVIRAGLSLVYPVPLGLLLAALLATTGGGWAGLSFVLGAWAGLVLFMAAIRAGSLCGYEAVTLNVNSNRAIQVLTAVLAGAATITIWVACWTLLTGNSEAALLGQEAWLVLIPAAVSVAIVYARIDTATPPRRPLLGRAATPVLAVIGLGVLVPFLLAGVNAPKRSAVDTAAGAKPDTLPLAWSPDSAPAERRFIVSDTGFVQARAPDSVTAGMDLILSLKDSAGKEIGRADDPPELLRSMAPGTYTLSLEEYRESVYGQEVSDPIFLSLAGRVIPAARDGRGRDARLQVSVVLVKGSVEGRRLINRGVDLARAGRILEALQRYDSAVARDSLRIVTASEWNVLCWYGSIAKELDKVRQACERAVDLDPTNVYHLDSRGLHRALTGDPTGAIRDFRSFANGAADSQESAQRRRWIEALNRGEDPFTDEELQSLR